MPTPSTSTGQALTTQKMRRQGWGIRLDKRFSEETMFDAGRRPIGRLFHWTLAVVIAAFGVGLPASAENSSDGVPTTTVSDTVYLADGSMAQGSLIITWPAFVTASGKAISAGNTNTTL